ncbi:hypothetical protein DPQ33_13190 [Oceanidesulfovibrio indonesiensis]|uniref:SPOR domain-containing protein n=1 Tax=Oceanidesulfovibrio indonesiensis TaxID=54767 RepID=A0A7M3MCS0_9BACT|nr:SPOR domain-containing protein [Oceanidesulfovibrio indonesiensis]TVM16269.1 hypothetical protein DPQ33_13190 [Oceanidesulfovibrio indonesiensis]
MLVNHTHTRSRRFLPAPGPVLPTTLVAALMLCCIFANTALGRINGDETPAIDWSQDTVALLPDGSPATQAREYAVQVTMMRDIGSAREMAAGLASRGYTPYILTMADESGALWHAVRLDIFENIASALEAARSFQSTEGVTPEIVEPGTMSGLSVEEARFFVQVAAFESEENALRHAAGLSAQGLDAGVVRRMSRDDETVWNVVHIGVFERLEDAAARAKEYAEETNSACYVVVISNHLLKKSTVSAPE